MLVFTFSSMTAFLRPQQWNVYSRLALSVQWILTFIIVFLMLINLKKKKDKIDILVIVLIMFKLFLNLMDFEEVRFTQSATQNMFYFGSLAFPLLTY